MENKTDFIFGIRSVIEAIRSGKEIDKILISKGLTGELVQEMLAGLKEANIPLQYVPIEKLNRITRKNHQGVIAFIAAVTYHQLDTLIPGLFEQGKVPFLLLLDGLTDVRNIGAIARTAECAGVDAIIIPEKGSAQINADAVKTSAGALHFIPVCRVKGMVNTIKYLKDCGLKIISATEKASDIYFHCNLKEPLALVLGAEDTGVDPDLVRLSDEHIRIPIQGHIESLNVSAAASVLIYEVVKQRMGE